jgi:hypothetical protein
LAAPKILDQFVRKLLSILTTSLAIRAAVIEHADLLTHLSLNILQLFLVLLASNFNTVAILTDLLIPIDSQFPSRVPAGNFAGAG